MYVYSESAIIMTINIIFGNLKYSYILAVSPLYCNSKLTINRTYQIYSYITVNFF